MSKTQQVGGSHYAAELQHWDVMEDFDIEYLLATASKYIMRWRKKGGLQDLKKSMSYIDRKLEENDIVRRVVSEGVLNRLADQYDLQGEERQILFLLHSSNNDINLAKRVLTRLIDEVENAPSYDVNDKQR